MPVSAAPTGSADQQVQEETAAPETSEDTQEAADTDTAEETQDSAAGADLGVRVLGVCDRFIVLRARLRFYPSTIGRLLRGHNRCAANTTKN